MSDPSQCMLVSFLTGLCVIAANDQRDVHAQHNRSIGPSPTSNLRVPEEDPLVGKCYARPVNRVYVPQVGGASVDGPGDGLEVDGYFAAGLGFDARLGEHWLLGAGATYANTFNTGARSLEVGMHAGYRWSLEGEDGSLIER